MKQTICAIICAAGKGLRAGFEKNKLLVPFGDSCALLQTLGAFDFPLIDEIVITASEEDYEEISKLASSVERAKVVLGGATRTLSVYNALKETNAELVLIHDGARAGVSREVIEGCVQSVKAFGSGICAIPCSDTIAVCENSVIKNVPDRACLWQIQTPQGFYRENIFYAYERAIESGDTFTDDSSVFARYCGKPHVCAGARENIKLTYAEDFRPIARCGFGIDTHAFGKAQDHIVLAGVKIPSDSGLIAHSDGDVAVHAVMDALLSAAGLKDIGHYFPDTDPAYAGANSLDLLQKVVDLIRENGYGVKNLSVAIQAEKPKMAKYIDGMKGNLAPILKTGESAIGITVGTNEKLGYVGEGKGITAYAYALLYDL